MNDDQLKMCLTTKHLLLEGSFRLFVSDLSGLNSHTSLQGVIRIFSFIADVFLYFHGLNCLYTEDSYKYFVEHVAFKVGVSLLGGI